MPISVTGSKVTSPLTRALRSGNVVTVSALGARSSSGFSLLELLVVLLLIGLIASAVTVNVNSGGRDIYIESSVRNLANVAEYVLDEAQIDGVNYGLMLREEGVDGDFATRYYWLQRDLDGWKPVSARADVFDDGVFPPDVEVQLNLSDAPVAELTLDQQDDQDEPDKERLLPQLVFYTNGEVTEGEIDVRQRDTGTLLWRIRWDLLGRFEVLRRGEEEAE